MLVGVVGVEELNEEWLDGNEGIVWLIFTWMCPVGMVA
jgi:hypothetical protein